MQSGPFGTYQLVDRLASQGHGRLSHPVLEVWHAYDNAHSRSVALRLVSVELSKDKYFKQLFESRVEAAQKLTGPHCVEIYTHGQVDDRLFVATQWIGDRNLEQMLRAGPLDGRVAVDFLHQVSQALDAIHSRGLLHNDVRPSSILIGGNDCAYLDVISVQEETFACGQSLIGTEPDPRDPASLHYMAPERIRSDSATDFDGRSDVYSLTCVLYECLTGRRPFVAGSLEQVVVGHLNGAPPRPSELRRDLPAALDRVIAKGLAKDPAERFACASEMVLAARAALLPDSTQSAPSPASNGDIAAAFDTLGRAEVLAFGGIGFANIKPPASKAFAAISAVGSAYRPLIEQLLDDGSPAGRVYAAMLLSGLDPAAGRMAWKRLSTQPDPLTEQGGCVVSTTTLAAYATKRLAALGADPVAKPSPATGVNRVAEPPPAPVPPTEAAPYRTTLRDLLAGGRLPTARATKIAINVAAALDTIHKQSGLHGAICPENIGLQARDFVHLIAKTNNSNEVDTLGALPDMIMFPYSAPEQFTSDRPPGPSADIYALTCVLYECLTGTPPFGNASLEQQLSGHLAAIPPRPSESRPELSAGFDRVVARGLAKKPDDRHQTASEFVRDVQKCGGGSYWHAISSTTNHPAVESVGHILESLQNDPRLVLVSARDEQQFVESLFPRGGRRTAVYVSRETRIGSSRGPHFDVYQSIVHPAFPFVATLNLVGNATVESTVLPPRLASYYYKHHPLPTENAYVARRLVSALALQHPRARIEKHSLEPGTGMIIPQQDGALAVVHDVQSQPAHGTDSYGLFLKFLVPRADAGAVAAAESQGFAPWQPGTDWAHERETPSEPDLPRFD